MACGVHGGRSLPCPAAWAFFFNFFICFTASDMLLLPAGTSLSFCCCLELLPVRCVLHSNKLLM